MAGDNPSITDAVRQFAHSLPPERHPDSQEALRFARWFGEERAATEIRPADLQAYVDSYGATAPNAVARADALKGFLAYAHKQGILPDRLVSHVRVRRPQQRARAASSTHAPPPEARMTAAGKEALQAELDALKVQRPQIAAELHAARADGDVRENAPLDAARETQGQLEARIREIEATLQNAVISANTGPATGDAAYIGCNVVIANLATGTQLSYQLVNAAEARPGTGKLSIESPVGKALVGRHAGDEVQVTAPSGTVRFRIERIET